uniref:Putative ovule protein n=1 Tax=Solanum chacoense TaxID=4108 RepID=A0A0V0H4Q7_SOLCH
MTLIHTQSLFTSSGQHPVVGFHQYKLRFIFFHTHTPDMTCSVATLDGSSNRNWPSFMAKTLTHMADFQVLQSHLLTSFKVGVSCSVSWNLPTMHLLRRFVSASGAPLVTSM